MNLEAERKLKFDRRLQGRRGLASDDELAAHLEALPDVSDKIQPATDSEEGAQTPSATDPGGSGATPAPGA